MFHLAYMGKQRGCEVNENVSHIPGPHAMTKNNEHTTPALTSTSQNNSVKLPLALPLPLGVCLPKPSRKPIHLRPLRVLIPYPERLHLDGYP
jgi:hypothetical protein